jgi:WD40 repeat protein
VLARGGTSGLPNGTMIASASDDHRVILWETDSGKNRHEWLLPGPVHCVAFAPDGRHLATGNSNGTIYIFRLTGLVGK